IKDREVLLGIKCPKCKRVYVPPRRLCGPCFVKMDELVELGNEGVVEASTLVNYPFIDPDTGENRPIPYIYGYIKLDGADNLLSHVIKTLPETPVKVGDRVKAVFADLKQGRIQDIEYFEPIRAR
ncbi:Zn-ribbon domain-containing OB-fold protein, partial [Thermodesulfobacteriota bacterium]